MLGIAGLLVVLWAVGFAVFPIVGGLIHIVLVIAVVLAIVHVIRGRSV
jgi:hypothetical protein